MLRARQKLSDNWHGRLHGQQIAAFPHEALQATRHNGLRETLRAARACMGMKAQSPEATPGSGASFEVPTIQTMATLYHPQCPSALLRVRSQCKVYLQHESTRNQAGSGTPCQSLWVNMSPRGARREQKSFDVKATLLSNGSSNNEKEWIEWRTNQIIQYIRGISE